MYLRFFSSAVWLLVALLLNPLFSGCGSKTEGPTPASTKPITKTPKSPSSESGSPVTAPVDYVASAIRAGEQSKGMLGLITIRKAIEAFQQEEGRNPESLDELAQKSYLKLMPKAPAGQKFDYDATTATVKLVPQ